MFHDNAVFFDRQQAKMLRNSSPLGFLLLSSRSSFRMVTFRKKNDSKYRSGVITRNYAQSKRRVGRKRTRYSWNMWQSLSPLHLPWRILDNRQRLCRFSRGPRHCNVGEKVSIEIERGCVCVWGGGGGRECGGTSFLGVLVFITVFAVSRSRWYPRPA